jgi:ATP-dependent Clp protease ATP-binding subunit ClpX
MFTKATFGVPQFYPRDLKRRVDDFVVGQDRAKKSICSVIFNHYQGLRRRQQIDESERLAQERQARQKYMRDRDLYDRHRDNHPLKGRFCSGESAHWKHADGVSP